MFNRNTFKKFRKNRAPNNVTLINILYDKSKYLIGRIIIVHFKRHDCIILFFNFDGFYDNQTKLLPKNGYCK